MERIVSLASNGQALARDVCYQEQDLLWKEAQFHLQVRQSHIDELNNIREDLRAKYSKDVEEMDNSTVVATLVLGAGIGFVVEGTFPPQTSDICGEEQICDLLIGLRVLYAASAALSLVLPFLCIMVFWEIRERIDVFMERFNLALHDVLTKVTIGWVRESKDLASFQNSATLRNIRGIPTARPAKLDAAVFTLSKQLRQCPCSHRRLPVAHSWQRWKYVAKNGLPMQLRAQPLEGAGFTDHFLQYGQSFWVSEVLPDPDSGVQFLRLADGSGWAFSRTVEKHEEMCTKEKDNRFEDTESLGEYIGIAFDRLRSWLPAFRASRRPPSPGPRGDVGPRHNTEPSWANWNPTRERSVTSLGSSAGVLLAPSEASLPETHSVLSFARTRLRMRRSMSAPSREPACLRCNGKGIVFFAQCGLCHGKGGRPGRCQESPGRLAARQRMLWRRLDMTHSSKQPIVLTRAEKYGNGDVEPAPLTEEILLMLSVHKDYAEWKRFWCFRLRQAADFTYWSGLVFNNLCCAVLLGLRFEKKYASDKLMWPVYVGTVLLFTGVFLAHKTRPDGPSSALRHATKRLGRGELLVSGTDRGRSSRRVRARTGGALVGHMPKASPSSQAALPNRGIPDWALFERFHPSSRYKLLLAGEESEADPLAQRLLSRQSSYIEEDDVSFSC